MLLNAAFHGIITEFLSLNPHAHFAEEAHRGYVDWPRSRSLSCSRDKISFARIAKRKLLRQINSENPHFPLPTERKQSDAATANITRWEGAAEGPEGRRAERGAAGRLQGADSCSDDRRPRRTGMREGEMKGFLLAPEVGRPALSAQGQRKRPPGLRLALRSFPARRRAGGGSRTWAAGRGTCRSRRDHEVTQ